LALAVLAAAASATAAIHVPAPELFPIQQEPQPTSVASDVDGDSGESAAASALTLEQVFNGENPQSLEQLEAMQQHWRELAAKVIPATVALQVGGAQGSGVIISSDGYILTAAHVIGAPGQPALVIMQDGSRLEARTLGLDREIDSGLLKINNPSDLPFLELGESEPLERGQWVMATGHPGGYESDRPAVVRIGRVLSNNNSVIRSDCTLVGGDSGGPLINMNGEVIGIHSRIGGTLEQNLHVPVDQYTDHWDELANSVVKGSSNPWIGLTLEDNSLRVESLVEGGPAETAGIQVGDELLRFGDTDLTNQASLRDALRETEPGNTIRVVLKRGDKEVEVDIVISAQ
jgi:serine protease Do